jgi:DNA-binding HxlR family transcriptional regulator
VKIGQDGSDRDFDVFTRDCPTRTVLEHVTSKWGVLVLAALREGTYRFSELRRRVDGVSEKMLSQTLRVLEHDGLIARLAYPEVPPRVEYNLTQLGFEAAELLVDLVSFIEQRMPQILDAQQALRVAPETIGHAVIDDGDKLRDA